MPTNKKLKYIKGKSKNRVHSKLSRKRSRKLNKKVIKRGGSFDGTNLTGGMQTPNSPLGGSGTQDEPDLTDSDKDSELGGETESSDSEDSHSPANANAKASALAEAYALRTAASAKAEAYALRTAKLPENPSAGKSRTGVIKLNHRTQIRLVQNIITSFKPIITIPHVEEVIEQEFIQVYPDSYYHELFYLSTSIHHNCYDITNQQDIFEYLEEYIYDMLGWAREGHRRITITKINIIEYFIEQTTIDKLQEMETNRSSLGEPIILFEYAGQSHYELESDDTNKRYILEVTYTQEAHRGSQKRAAGVLQAASRADEYSDQRGDKKKGKFLLRALDRPRDWDQSEADPRDWDQSDPPKKRRSSTIVGGGNGSFTGLPPKNENENEMKPPFPMYSHESVTVQSENRLENEGSVCIPIHYNDLCFFCPEKAVKTTDCYCFNLLKTKLKNFKVAIETYDLPPKIPETGQRVDLNNYMDLRDIGIPAKVPGVKERDDVQAAAAWLAAADRLAAPGSRSDSSMNENRSGGGFVNPKTNRKQKQKYKSKLKKGKLYLKKRKNKLSKKRQKQIGGANIVLKPDDTNGDAAPPANTAAAYFVLEDGSTPDNPNFIGKRDGSVFKYKQDTDHNQYYYALNQVLFLLRWDTSHDFEIKPSEEFKVTGQQHHILVQPPKITSLTMGFRYDNTNPNQNACVVRSLNGNILQRANGNEADTYQQIYNDDFLYNNGVKNTNPVNLDDMGVIIFDSKGVVFSSLSEKDIMAYLVTPLLSGFCQFDQGGGVKGSLRKLFEHFEDKIPLVKDVNGRNRINGHFWDKIKEDFVGEYCLSLTEKYQDPGSGMSLSIGPEFQDRFRHGNQHFPNIRDRLMHNLVSLGHNLEFTKIISLLLNQAFVHSGDNNDTKFLTGDAMRTKQWFFLVVNQTIPTGSNSFAPTPYAVGIKLNEVVGRGIKYVSKSVWVDEIKIIKRLFDPSGGGGFDELVEYIEKVFVKDNFYYDNGNNKWKPKRDLAQLLSVLPYLDNMIHIEGGELQFASWGVITNKVGEPLHVLSDACTVNILVGVARRFADKSEPSFKQSIYRHLKPRPPMKDTPLQIDQTEQLIIQLLSQDGQVSWADANTTGGKLEWEYSKEMINITTYLKILGDFKLLKTLGSKNGSFFTISGDSWALIVSEILKHASLLGLIGKITPQQKNVINLIKHLSPLLTPEQQQHVKDVENITEDLYFIKFNIPTFQKTLKEWVKLEIPMMEEYGVMYKKKQLEIIGFKYEQEVKYYLDSLEGGAHGRTLEFLKGNETFETTFYLGNQIPDDENLDDFIRRLGDEATATLDAIKAVGQLIDKFTYCNTIGGLRKDERGSKTTQPGWNGGNIKTLDTTESVQSLCFGCQVAGDAFNLFTNFRANKLLKGLIRLNGNFVQVAVREPNTRYADKARKKFGEAQANYNNVLASAADDQQESVQLMIECFNEVLAKSSAVPLEVVVSDDDIDSFNKKIQINTEINLFIKILLTSRNAFTEPQQSTDITMDPMVIVTRMFTGFDKPFKDLETDDISIFNFDIDSDKSHILFSLPSGRSCINQQKGDKSDEYCISLTKILRDELRTIKELCDNKMNDEIDCWPINFNGVFETYYNVLTNIFDSLEINGDDPIVTLTNLKKLIAIMPNLYHGMASVKFVTVLRYLWEAIIDLLLFYPTLKAILIDLELSGQPPGGSGPESGGQGPSLSPAAAAAAAAAARAAGADADSIDVQLEGIINGQTMRRVNPPGVKKTGVVATTPEIDEDSKARAAAAEARAAADDPAPVAAPVAPVVPVGDMTDARKATEARNAARAAAAAVDLDDNPVA